MEVLSYYREDNIVTLAIKFNQINNNAFQEELNIEHLKIVQDNNVSGELFGQFSYLSSNKKDLLLMVMIDIVTESITIDAKNLMSMTDGTIVHSGNWNIDIELSKRMGYIKKISDTYPVCVKIYDREYKVLDLYRARNILVFKCEEKTIISSEIDTLSSQYGSQIIIEYSDGSSNQDYYCVPHGRDELAVVVDDYSYLDNMSQIYIDGLKLIEDETNINKYFFKLF